MTSWRAGVLFLLLILVGLPLLLPFAELLHPGAWTAWSEGPRLLGLMRNTLLLITGTLVLALPAGTVTGVLLYRTDLPGRGLLRFLTVLTLFVPLPLLASGWQAALGSGGWLPVTFWTVASAGDPDVLADGMVWQAWGKGINAAVWIHAVAALPWVVLVTGQGLGWVERDLEEEALTLASPWRVLWRVTIRRSLAAMGAASLWVLLQTATEITVTDMFQVRTFAEEVYTQYVAPEMEGGIPDAESAVARAVAVSLPSVLLTWFLVLAAARSWEKSLPPRETLTTQPHVFSLGQARWPCLVLLLAVGLILVGVPVASLAWKVGLAGNPPGWSSLAAVSHLNKVVLTRGRLVGASLLSAATVGAAAALLGLLTCWLARGSRWFHTAVLLLVGAAWALPGPVVGLGLKAAIALLMDLDRSGLAARLLYHGPSPVPVLWADLVRFFPCAVALLWPVVRLLPPELCDAARTDGARPAQELRHVVWPLTAPSVLCAGLAVGVLCLGELSAGKLVATPGSPTYAHEVFTQMHYGVTNDLAALNLILLVTVILGGLVVVVASRIPRLYNGQHQ